MTESDKLQVELQRDDIIVTGFGSREVIRAATRPAIPKITNSPFRWRRAS